MTQAPATPELVESDDWALEIAACGFANDSTLPESVRSFIKDLWRAYCAMEERADALEAQQARIAELEVENERLRLTMLGGEDVAGFASSLPLAQVLDSFRTYETALRDRANSAQALADRYEKALREISDLADECVVFDAENVAAVEAAPDKAAASPGFSVLRYWNERLKLSKSWKRRIDEIRDQALSSQGRHEGGEDGLPELPGVNAVPLPALPDGPSQMDRVWAAVNVLGAPDTACTSDEDRAYCRAIGDALSEIEKLGGRPQ